MASSGKKKTTMAKLNRERRLRERRANKEARKQARRLGLLDTDADTETDDAEDSTDVPQQPYLGPPRPETAPPA
jgi:hypothetical protein